MVGSFVRMPRRAFRNNIFVLSLKFYSIKTLHNRNTPELLKKECRMKSQNIWVLFEILTIVLSD